MTVTVLERVELPDLELPCDRVGGGLCRINGVAAWVVKTTHGCNYLYCEQCRLDMLEAFRLPGGLECRGCGCLNWGSFEDLIVSITPL